MARATGWYVINTHTTCTTAFFFFLKVADKAVRIKHSFLLFIIFVLHLFAQHFNSPAHLVLLKAVFLSCLFLTPPYFVSAQLHSLLLLCGEDPHYHWRSAGPHHPVWDCLPTYQLLCWSLCLLYHDWTGMFINVMLTSMSSTTLCVKTVFRWTNVML